MCAECGHMFTRLGHLRRHTRLHTGDKPFMCNRCACQFARADHLRRHLQAHHADDPTLHPKDLSLVPNIKSELDVLPYSTSDLCLVDAPGVSVASGPGMGLNLPVFPGPEMVKSDNGSRESPGQRDEDLASAAGDNLSRFTMSVGGTSEMVSEESFPGPGVEESNQPSYRSVDYSGETQRVELDAGKPVVSKDYVGQTTGSSGRYDTQTLASSVPVFPSQEVSSSTPYPAVETPAELKSHQLDRRKSASTEVCSHQSAVSRFQESTSTSSVSLPEARNFPASADSRAFRADLWHRTSPAYMNDRLFLAGAVNLRHFDAGFSRSPPEHLHANLAHRYSQSHSMMPGNFFGGVMDFRRLPPENANVSSQQAESDIPATSPLSLARYQRK